MWSKGDLIFLLCEVGCRTKDSGIRIWATHIRVGTNNLLVYCICCRCYRPWQISSLILLSTVSLTFAPKWISTVSSSVYSHQNMCSKHKLYFCIHSCQICSSKWGQTCLFSQLQEKSCFKTSCLGGAGCEVILFNCFRGICLETSVTFGTLKQISVDEHVKGVSLGRAVMCW